MTTTIPAETMSLITTALTFVFYLIMLGFITYSFLVLYALNRYGKSKIVSLVVTMFYIIITSGLFNNALDNLTKIKLK
jgi:hypothetical protein